MKPITIHTKNIIYKEVLLIFISSLILYY